MLYYLAGTLYVVSCFLLLLVVLLQQGKGGDMASAFGGGGSQTAFGARAGATVLTKATTVLGVLFMLGAIVLGNPRTEWPGIGDGGRGWTGASAAAADCTAAARDAAGDAATCSTTGDAGEAAGTAAAGPAAAEVASAFGREIVSFRWLPPSGGRNHPRNAESTDCESGGTGRRTSLRGWRSQERESSNLSFRTIRLA